MRRADFIKQVFVVDVVVQLWIFAQMRTFWARLRMATNIPSVSEFAAESVECLGAFIDAVSVYEAMNRAYHPTA